MNTSLLTVQVTKTDLIKENAYLNTFFAIGQIELYTHHSFLPTLVKNLQRLGIRVCATYLIESQFMEDRYKFFRYVISLHVAHPSQVLDLYRSGVLSAMSAMVNLEVPWINIMSKMDLIMPNPEGPSGGGRNGLRNQRNIARYLEPDPLLLAHTPGQEANVQNPRFHSLNQAIVQLVCFPLSSLLF